MLAASAPDLDQIAEQDLFVVAVLGKENHGGRLGRGLHDGRVKFTIFPIFGQTVTAGVPLERSRRGRRRLMARNLLMLLLRLVRLLLLLLMTGRTPLLLLLASVLVPRVQLHISKIIKKRLLLSLMMMSLFLLLLLLLLFVISAVAPFSEVSV